VSAKRRGLEATKALLGPATNVRAYAFGRAHARMTNGAWGLIAIFGTAFVVVLIALQTILIPGVLLVLVLYGMVRPRRGVAVTDDGVVVMALSGWNGTPRHVIDTQPHAALRAGIRGANGSKVNVQLGSDLITLKRADFESLLAAAPDAAVPPPPPGALRTDV
jgi:hypothetical protein